MPAPVEVADDSAKYQALEHMLIAVQEKLDSTKDALNKRVSDTNKLIEMIKDDFVKTFEEHDKQLMKNISRTNVCEIRIDALEKQMKDYHYVPPPNLGDLDSKEALRALRDLEAKMNAIKEGNLSLMNSSRFNEQDSSNRI